ncbi:MAG: c-type cytochrome [Burkholderiales bacterium]|nr:c-type cytochrome [Burkholderiales bacterium]
MSLQACNKALFSTLAASLFLSFSPSALAVDADAAQALIKTSKCTKCHSVDKKKDGPPFKETAKKYKEKYKDKAEAEQKLYMHLTTNPKVKIDGKEEEHDSLKTKNEADIRNVIQWILSL